jgi:L-fuconolactonase
MRIDSHQHFWRYKPAMDSWITDQMSMLRRDFLPDELGTELRANGVDASIAVQVDQSETETLSLLDLAKRYPNVAGVVGWVDLAAPNVAERLKFFSQFEKLCGFRHIVQAEPDDRFMLRSDFVHGIAEMRAFDFTYDILIYPKQLPAAIGLVEKFPEQRFVIDHIAKPAIKTHQIGPWADHIRTIAKGSAVMCKLSGLVTEADWNNWRAEDFRPYLDVVFEAFGTERLMFGSDWPVCLLAGTYKDVKQLTEDYVRDLPGPERNNIFGLNAARFYGLRLLG